MIRRILLVLILAGLTVAGTSCFQPSPPKAEYIDHEITNVHMQGIVVNFYFDVENPNPVPIDVSKYSYTIYIDNSEFLKESRAGFNLPANGKKRIAIPVTLRYDRVFGTALSVLELIAQGKKNISYRIDGELYAGAMGVTVGTPMKASGTIPLPENITR
jgi:LEA14-like dessication related protein